MTPVEVATFDPNLVDPPPDYGHRRLRVYRAEDKAAANHPATPLDGTVEAAQRYVDRIVASAWWKRTCPPYSDALNGTWPVVKVHVVEGRDGGGYCLYGVRWHEPPGRSGAARRARSGVAMTLRLGHGHLHGGPAIADPWVILHELAHCLAVRGGHRGHGREFARAFVLTVDRWLGTDAAAALRAAYVTEGIKWRAPTRPTLSGDAPGANGVYPGREPVERPGRDEEEPTCTTNDPLPAPAVGGTRPGGEVMATIAQVRGIGDVERRAKAAAKIVREAQVKADEARSERDLAAVVLHKREGWPPVRVYRALGVSRGLFVRMVLRAPDTLPAIDAPERVMRRAAKTVERNDALVDEAREVRDEAARGMLTGKYRKPTGTLYRNAEVARITGLTTARIAQMRQGRR